MKNILLANVDVIFGIARQNGVAGYTADGMFMRNLVAGEEIYEDLKTRRQLDYAALGAVWNALDAGAQFKMSNDYRAVNASLYTKLAALSKAEKCDEMLALVERAVADREPPAPEAPAEE